MWPAVFMPLVLALGTTSLSAVSSRVQVTITGPDGHILTGFPRPFSATMTVQRGSKVVWKVTTQGLSCVTSSEISSDEHYILNVADGCGYAQLWDVKTGQRVWNYNSQYYRQLFATFTPDSKRVVLSFSDELDRFTGSWLPALWSIEQNRRVAVLYAPNAGSFRVIHFSKDGRYMIFTNGYNSESVFNAITGAYKQTLPHYLESGAADARLSADGTLAVVLYQNNAVVQYQVAGGRMLRLIRKDLGRNVGLPDPIEDSEIDWK